MGEVPESTHLSHRNDELLEWDRKHVGHWVVPFGQNAGLLADRSDGVSWYTSEGFQVFDGSSQLMCVNLGYREEYKREVADAVAAQIKRLPYSTNFWGFANQATISATQALKRIAPPELEVFLFTPGGGESVETAFQLSRAYWKNRGMLKYKFISLQNSYHGIYFGSGSATRLGNGAFTRLYGPLASGFAAAPDYYCFRCPLGLTYPECGLRCAQQIESVIHLEDPETVAAVIVEVEHGTAGCIPSPPGYMRAVREICDRNEVHLIIDEVMTGFGRTSVSGNAFACQIEGIGPDLMAMAKGLTSAYMPLGAVGISREVADGLGGLVLSGPTYAGHPVSCAAAAKVMEIYVRDHIFEHAAEIGSYARTALESQVVSTIPEVDHVSGLGMLLGLEIVKDPARKEGYPHEALETLQEVALEKGLYIRVAGAGSRIMFCPPLVSTEEEIDRMVDILRQAFEDGGWR
jgi:adenosylmethionine-8-amino-7-oxononanoate aminotransferase